MPDHVFLHDMNLNAGQRAYRQSIDRLSDDITNTFGKIPVEVIDYSPAVLSNELYIKYNSLDGSGEENMDEEVRNYFSTALAGTPRGKLLLQYRPGKTCLDMASWRLWVENQEIGSRTEEWKPAHDQIYHKEGLSQNPLRRQACPLPDRATTLGVTSRNPTTTYRPSSDGQQTLLPLTTTNNTSKSSEGLKNTTVMPGIQSNVAKTAESVSMNSSHLFSASSTAKAASIFTTIYLDYLSMVIIKPTKTVTIFPTQTSTIVFKPQFSASDSSTESSILPMPTSTSHPPPLPPSPTLPLALHPPPPSSPKSSEGVVILFEESYRSAGGVGGQWIMFPRKRDESEFDVCKAQSVGWKAALASRKKLPWPPGIDAQKEVFGRKRCKYIGVDSGAGRFSCDGVSEFECVKDPFYDISNAHQSCGSRMSQRILFPRVICWFP